RCPCAPFRNTRSTWAETPRWPRRTPAPTEARRRPRRAGGCGSRWAGRLADHGAQQTLAARPSRLLQRLAVLGRRHRLGLVEFPRALVLGPAVGGDRLGHRRTSPRLPPTQLFLVAIAGRELGKFNDVARLVEAGRVDRAHARAVVRELGH